MEKPGSGVAALGLVAHTGWAWLVRVRGTAETAAAEHRCRVQACEVVQGQLYHLASERRGDGARYLETRRAVMLSRTRDALAPHLEGASRAVVVGKSGALPPFDRIVAAHPRIHAAEGELWRALLAEACEALGLAVARREAGDARETLSGRLGQPAIAGFLAAGRARLGAPWTREVQDAALGAWSALA